MNQPQPNDTPRKSGQSGADTSQAGERTQKTFVRYIDMTPTWIGILPVLLETKDHPDSQSELEKMAKLADRLNTPLHKSAPELLKSLREYVLLETSAAPYSASPMRLKATAAIAAAEGKFRI